MAIQPQTKTPGTSGGTIHPGTVQRTQRTSSPGAPKQAMRIPTLPWLDFSPKAMQQRSDQRAQSDITGLEGALPTTQSIQATYEPQQQAAVSLGNAVADHLRAAQQYQAGLGAVGGAPSQATTGQVYAQQAPAAQAGQALAYGQANALGSAGDAAALRGLAQSQLFGRQETQALTNRQNQESQIESRLPGLESGYLQQERTLANSQNVARQNAAVGMLEAEGTLGLNRAKLGAEVDRINKQYDLGMANLGSNNAYRTATLDATTKYRNSQMAEQTRKDDATIAHWGVTEKNQRIQAAAAYLRAQNGGANSSKVDEQWMLRASAAADKALKGGTETVPSGNVKVTFGVLDPVTQNPVLHTETMPKAQATPAGIAKAYGVADPSLVHIGNAVPVQTKVTSKGSYQEVYNSAYRTLLIHYTPDLAKALATRIAKERLNPPVPNRFPSSATKSAPRSSNAPG